MLCTYGFDWTFMFWNNKSPQHTYLVTANRIRTKQLHTDSLFCDKFQLKMKHKQTKTQLTNNKPILSFADKNGCVENGLL